MIIYVLWSLYVLMFFSGSASWLSSKAFISGAGGSRFKSQDNQIERSVANSSPPLHHFFKRSCVAWVQWRRDGLREFCPLWDFFIRDFVQFGIAFNLGFCPIHDFVHYGFCPSQNFVQFDILSILDFVQFRIFSILDFIEFGIFFILDFVQFEILSSSGFCTFEICVFWDFVQGPFLTLKLVAYF